MPVVLRWLLRLGPMNPIAVRLVQGGSRRARHFYIRASYLGVLIATLLYSLLYSTGQDELDYRQLAAAGALAFQGIAYLQIALICLLAPVFMAGAIAQEGDPRTWDIQLTTPLTATEIVLGNLWGRLFFVLALLVSSMPLFAVTQYFGGVPGRSILASYVISACAATLVGAVAVALSVSRLVGKRAVFAFYVAVVSYMAVTWGLDAAVGGGRVSWFTALNPFLSLHALLNPTSYAAAAAGSQAWPGSWFLERPVATWCGLSLGVSGFLMVVSAVTVRLGGIAGLGGVGGRDGASSRGGGWLRRMLGLRAPGSGDGGNARTGRTVGHNPIAWREAISRNATLGRTLMRWSFIGVGVLFGAGLVWAYHTGRLSATDYRLAVVFTVAAEIIVVTLVALNMSATAVTREREDGTLDLLLTTPITPGAYLTGKLKGMVAYLLPLAMVPVATLLLGGLYVLAGGFGQPVAVTSRLVVGTVTAPLVLPEAGLTVGVVLVAFVALCVMVGLHWSLKSKGTIGAVITTVAIMGVIGAVLGLCAYKSGQDVSVLGPSLAAATPVTAALASVDPGRALVTPIGSGSLGQARVGMMIGAGVWAGAYALIVYAMHASLVRGFDMTVRRLAGNK